MSTPMTDTTSLRERIEREADAHDYFAANPDLRMTTGDHAARAKSLRAIAAALSARDEAGAVAIYQHEFSPGEWHDITHEEYERTGAIYRRVLYTPPAQEHPND